jgi:long-chain acyl-CoA synthetase
LFFADSVGTPDHPLPLLDHSDHSGSMALPILVSILIPIVLAGAVAVKKTSDERRKPKAVPVDVGGEPGYAVRNQRYLSLLETPWEGADTIAALFEQACAKNSDRPLLGTRVVISRETIVSSDGRPFEKQTLGQYQWTTFDETLEQVINFSAGLVAIGLQKGEKVAIFAETRAEWFVALQACFRRNATVVTIYASLGDIALVHSLNETEVGTVICDRKQLNKLLDLSKQLEFVKHVVYMEDDVIKSEPTLTGASTEW